MTFIEDESSIVSDFYLSLSRVIIPTDIDDDGDIDIAIGTGDHNNNSHTPDYLFENKSENNWFKVKLFGTMSNQNAIGAKVFICSMVEGEKKWQSRRVSAYSGRYGQAGYELHFGLGSSDQVDSVEIHWPSGKISYLSSLAANKTYGIVEPFLRFVGENEVCEYDSIYFNMPQTEGVSYSWFMNDSLMTDLSASKWQIIKSGRYKCIITQHNQLPDTTNEIEVVINPAPEVIIDFVGSKEFCPGDSVLLKSTHTLNCTSIWIIGQDTLYVNSDSLYINNGTTINSIVTNKYGCVAKSNTLVSVQYKTPDLFIGEDRIICDGDTIQVGYPEISYSYKWNTGMNSNYINIYQEGSYFVEILDTNACMNYDTIEVRVVPNPEIDIGPDTTVSKSKCISLTDQLDNSLLNFIWNDEIETGNYIFCGENKELGFYEVHVKAIDTNNCMAYDTVLVKVLFQTDDDGNPVDKFIVFPNVTNQDEISFYIPDGFLTVDSKVGLYNLDGTLVKTISLKENENWVYQIDISSLDSGRYFFVITNENKSHVKSFLIIR